MTWIHRDNSAGCGLARRVARGGGLALRAEYSGASSAAYRGHEIGVCREHTYRTGMALLAQWGYPEPGDLGPWERPSLLGKAVALHEQQRLTVELLAVETALPVTVVRAVVEAATERISEL